MLALNAFSSSRGMETTFSSSMMLKMSLVLEFPIAIQYSETWKLSARSLPLY